MSDNSREQRLAAFVGFVREHIRGDEKGEAQVFLDRLFQAFGQPGAIEAGAVYEDRLKRPDRRGVSFADLVWGETLLVEMKKRGEHLAKHTQQMLDYWMQLAGRRPAYCLLCNFDELWIYDFNKDILGPLDKLRVEDLPERYGALAFLFPTNESPVFGDDHEAVTRKAADHLVFVFNSIESRGIDRLTAQRFTLQILVAMFAEDIGLLDRYFLARLLEECISPEAAYDTLGGLFTAMNTAGGVKGGRYKGVDYFNGGLFEKPAPVELEPFEVKRLRDAAEANWSKVRPEIFGTIFEHSMEQDERHAYGVQFTSQPDILKIVKPTIVDPWEQLIEQAERGSKPIEKLNKLHLRLQSFRVLDPACGSGNFLYMAYRELKRVEAKLIEAIKTTSREKTPMFGRVTARQFFGIDISPFAVELAKVTLMIARKLAIDELHIEEKALPLDNLDANFLAADALIEFDDDGATKRPEWFPADVIIGNPPFLGAKRMKPERGTDYVNAVRKLYPEVPGMADYCVYWIRRAHDHLPECTPDDPVSGRAGLVGTQNIRNNKSREGGLDYVVQSGVIVEAVDNQPWSGEANVHVSIANWVKTSDPENAGEELLVPEKRRLWATVVNSNRNTDRKRTPGVRKDKTYELVFRRCDIINSALSGAHDVSAAKILKCNKNPQRCFQGIVTGYNGFILTKTERKKLIAKDPRSADVVRPYLIGRDLVTGTGKPSRAVIDFADRNLLDAQAYSGAFQIVESCVLPKVLEKAQNSTKSSMANARNEHLNRWWQFWNVRVSMRVTFAELDRFIAVSRTTKRPVFAFVTTDVCPDSKIQTFALDDDYSFGVIQGNPHWHWLSIKGARLKTTHDRAYSSRSVWDTFPWPQFPSNEDVLAVAEAGRAIRQLRDEHLPKMKGGLRELYRTLEVPGKNPLKDAHAALDAAVLKAYGFSAEKDILAQLLALNLEVAARENAGEPVTAPGIPASFIEAGGDAASLVTDDCIRAD